nr:uncharacterized protein LOC129383201 isoform X2 [Dermacentor andersoni]
MRYAWARSLLSQLNTDLRRRRLHASAAPRRFTRLGLRQELRCFCAYRGSSQSVEARPPVQSACSATGWDEADQEDEAQIVLTLDQWDQPAVPLKELKALAVPDEVLSQVRKYTREGWPRSFDMETKEMAEF